MTWRGCGGTRPLWLSNRSLLKNRHSPGGELKQQTILTRPGARWGLVASIALLAASCDGSPGSEAQQPEPALHGASLVVGTSVDQWSLLTVPLDGGVAEARDFSDLQRVVWTGRTELPPSVEAHALAGGRVVLRTAAGAVHTYDPPSDALVRVGDVAPEAIWMGDGSVGLYLSPGGSLLEVSRDGVWRYGLDREVAWAAPAEGGVIVVLDDGAESRTLYLLRRDEDQTRRDGRRPRAFARCGDRMGPPRRAGVSRWPRSGRPLGHAARAGGRGGPRRTRRDAGDVAVHARDLRGPG